MPDPQTTDERWAEVIAVEREIRLMSNTSAGDPKLADNMKMLAFWSGRLRKAIGDDR
jgi:hypothetical protein